MMAQATDVALVTSVFVFTLLIFNATARKATWATATTLTAIIATSSEDSWLGVGLSGLAHGLLVLAAGITPLYVL